MASTTAETSSPENGFDADIEKQFHAKERLFQLAPPGHLTYLAQQVVNVDTGYWELSSGFASFVSFTGPTLFSSRYLR